MRRGCGCSRLLCGPLRRNGPPSPSDDATCTALCIDNKPRKVAKMASQADYKDRQFLAVIGDEVSAAAWRGDALPRLGD